MQRVDALVPFYFSKTLRRADLSCGIVRGYAQSEAERRKVGERIKGIKGVRAVENEIQTGPLPE